MADGVSGAESVEMRKDGAVVELLLTAPGRNALVPPLRAELARALESAFADDGIRAIVLRGTGGNFSSGLDLGEIGRQAAPTVADLCRMLEDGPKPVVAAIEGVALGAGLDLALAAHWRIAEPAARMGYPEILLGLVPCAGGTQRLPRLIGGAEAVRLLMSGDSVGVAEAIALGLIDRVAEGDLAAAAQAMAAEATLRPTGGRDIGGRQAVGYQQAVARTRAGLDGHLAGPGRLLDCIEAAQLLPFSQGLEFEAAAFAEVAGSDEVAGLIRAHQASVLATAIPARLAGGTLPQIDRLAILGAGPDAISVAIQALARGLGVTLVEPDRDRLVAALERIAALQQAEVAAGRLTEQARDDEWARLSPTLGSDGVGAGDLLLAEPGAGVPPERQALMLGALPETAGVSLVPGPAPGRMAEICLSDPAQPDGVARAIALVRRMGWRHAVTGLGGPVDRRMRRALAQAVAAEERAGRAPSAIAAALAGYGLGMPPRGGLPAAGPEGDRIVAHCLLAIMNEGARMLDEGVAARPAVIDAVAVGNGLFPRHRGGPMFQADRRGLLLVRSALVELAVAEPEIYAPAARIEVLLRDGRNFAALDK